MAPTRMAYRGEDVGTESTPSNPYGSRPSSPVSAAIDIFAQFDPFSRRGVKASKAAVGSFDAAAASSAQSEVVTDVSAGDMWTTPMKKNSTETPTGYDAPDSSITTPAAGNADAWTTVPTKNKKAGTTFTGYDNQGVAHVQIAVAPSTASSTWATTAASVTASTAFEENVASGRYGRPGRTTPLRETSGGGGAWFKSVSTCFLFPPSLSPPHLPLIVNLSTQTNAHRPNRLRETLPTTASRLTPLLISRRMLRRRHLTIMAMTAQMICRCCGTATS